MHIYNSPELGKRQRCGLFRTVENMELVQLSAASEKELKRFNRFFDIEISEGIRSFQRNYDKMDEASRNCGIFCIHTNTALTSGSV